MLIYTNCIFLKKSEVGEQNMMYADIKKYGVKLAIIRAYPNLFIRENGGYKMVCMTDLYTVSELGFNTST